jgi:hypothetical protein
MHQVLRQLLLGLLAVLLGPQQMHLQHPVLLPQSVQGRGCCLSYMRDGVMGWFLSILAFYECWTAAHQHEDPGGGAQHRQVFDKPFKPTKQSHGPYNRQKKLLLV